MTELMDIRNGIKLTSRYTRNVEWVEGGKLYIYVGYVNDILTKYVTGSEWNYKLRISFDENREGDKIVYIDDKNQEILVFEKDEGGWYEF